MHVVTDDERRRVVERLMEQGIRFYSPSAWDALGEALGIDGPHNSDTVCARLADLIEPKPVEFDGLNHGIDSIYQWCFERLEGADEAEDELYCSIMRAIEDYRHPERVTASTVRPVNREALLALADEMDLYARTVPYPSCGKSVAAYARCVREACGEAGA